MESKKYAFSRFLYIVEAALEYFVSIAVGTVYLAKITASVGMPDSITGILTAFVSLGCGFQIIALFLAHKKPVKRWVTVSHIISQSLFAILYFVPLLEISREWKIVLLILSLFLAQLIHNAISSPKINWYMSLIDDKKRGSFTANKEIVSLITGVIFTTTMSAIIDAFQAAENLNGAFIFCGLALFGLTVLHSLTLIFSKEKPAELVPKTNTIHTVKELATDKTLLKVIFVSVLWYVANYSATPFYGTYLVKELGFSMLLVSILSAVGAFSRALFSRPFGKFADKHSFTQLINICFIIEFFAFTINTLTVPSNGKVFYAIYLILHSIGMAGINSSAINLIYDYVDKSKRISALALKSAIAGITGFVTTLVVGLLVDNIQANGNVFLGLNVYAQQVVSAIAAIATLVVIIYVNLVIKKIKRN